MRFLFLTLAVMTAAPVLAQERGTVLPDERRDTRLTPAARLDAATGLPVTLYHSDYVARGASALEMAWAYLREHGADLGLTDPYGQLEHTSVREMPTGYRVRFRQVVDGIPVFRGDLAVSIGRDGTVHFVSNGTRPLGDWAPPASKTTIPDLEEAARRHVGFQGQPVHLESDRVIYALSGAPRAAHRVRLVNGVTAWDILVDEETGRVFRAEPTSHLAPSWSFAPRTEAPAGTFRGQDPGPETGYRRVDGTGMVFDPDPMTTAGVSYGEAPGYQDNADRDSDVLTAARRQVTLREITDTGSDFRLQGPLVEIRDFDAPFLGIFEQSTSEFDYTRSHPAFEATTVYHHIDQSMRYINETLGIALAPIQYETGVQVDPHGLEAAVNAQYLFTGQLRFGDGGVDMSEDPEVILHELGHGIHDWITDLNLSQGAGLGEGSADYWAASYTRSTGLWNPADPRIDNFGRWGGRPFFQGRRTDYPARFPFDLTSAIHTDGQIWSTAMIRIWDLFGRDVADRVFLEGLSMTGQQSNTEDAARAVLKADSLLFGAQHAEQMIEAFVEGGFLFRAAAAGAGRSGPGPLTVNFFDLSTFGAGTATSWAWDFQSDGVVDDTRSVTSFTYDEPGLYSVTLTASDGTRTESTTLTDYVSVNSGVYVWEGFGEPQGRSGRYIYESLLEAGVEAHYSRTARPHPNFSGYDAVFLSFGPFDPQNLPVPLADTDAKAVRDYVLLGGRVFIEGAEVFGRDQAANANLRTTFGIAGVSTGSSSQPVTSLAGQPGSLAAGLLYTSSRQRATTSVDVFQPGSGGRAMLEEDGYGIVGVQNQPSGGGRTVVMSYTMADLEASGTSNRDALLTAIMDYFGMPIVLNGQVDFDVPEGLLLEGLYPVPADGLVSVRFVSSRAGTPELIVHDLLGREVLRRRGAGMARAGLSEQSLDVSGLSSGAYLVTVRMAGREAKRPLIVTR